MHPAIVWRDYPSFVTSHPGIQRVQEFLLVLIGQHLPEWRLGPKVRDPAFTKASVDQSAQAIQGCGNRDPTGEAKSANLGWVARTLSLSSLAFARQLFLLWFSDMLPIFCCPSGTSDSCQTFTYQRNIRSVNVLFSSHFSWSHNQYFQEMPKFMQQYSWGWPMRKACLQLDCVYTTVP